MLQHVLFYVFASGLILSALGVISARSPVQAALCLVLCFVLMAPLWLMLDAEFLALVLVFVYVGAVMTLFLFVVMMLNLSVTPRHAEFMRYLPFGLLLLAALTGLMVYVLLPSHFAAFQPMQWLAHDVSYSNTRAIGQVLYTDYVYAFEIAAVVLLVAMVAAISLAFRGVRQRKQQVVSEQVQVTKQERLRIINVPTETDR